MAQLTQKLCNQMMRKREIKMENPIQGEGSVFLYQ